ncbi:MAG TPA: M14 family zinc carboxypeptidase [Fibrobacteria bacterium]|nr:M14 family zinc carboxypeptidase [Fibrobacteria bacterium]
MRSIIGRSVEGREMVLLANFPLRGDPAAVRSDPRSTLLIGGTHGDERATVAILDNFAASRLGPGGLAHPVAVLSLHNPDGHAADMRYNARGVDLNRNFTHNWSPDSEEPAGPVPLSEPETAALHAFILARRPAKIVSLHWALSEIDADGPQSTALALAMWGALSEEERKPYRLRVHRPEAPAASFCPGSLGQWCGNGLVYPDGSRPAMVTLELPYHAQAYERPDSLPDGHLESVRALWRARPEAYLAGVQGPVHRMLEAACRLGHASGAPAPAAEAG